MHFESVNIQGGFFSQEMLDQIHQGDLVGQKPGDFNFGKSQRINELIGIIWVETKRQWEIFKSKQQRLPEDDAGTSLTRKAWMEPFFDSLGIQLKGRRQAYVINEKTYSITHVAENLDDLPFFIASFRDTIDVRREIGGVRLSPHGMIQEYLNLTEHLFGVVTNGYQLRLLRDNNRLTKLAFIEFDLVRMMEEDLYNDFVLLYRLLHFTRFPDKKEESEACLLESYYQQSIDAGSRIREKLRKAVKESMEMLANGILDDNLNQGYHDSIRNKDVTASDLYSALLRTVYRLIFLVVIEERKLVHPPEQDVVGDPEMNQRQREIYSNYYSIQRLIQLAENDQYVHPAKHDIWQSLLTTFRLFEPGDSGVKLGIQPLGGALFSTEALATGKSDLYEVHIRNEVMLNVLAKFTWFENDQKQLTKVNYSDLDVEELGSVYEGLLELHPVFKTSSTPMRFGFTKGSERKITGSYYTRHDLVAQLLKTSMEPLLRERLNGVGWSRATLSGDKNKAEEAILSIDVLDPSCGSGHFLLGAARMLAMELAMIRSGEENPGERWVLEARREVIQKCIYGVDKNASAVELCRLALWLEGHNSGKPLSFLEHKIRCGDSLVGVHDQDILIKGIPDGAFKPVSADNKTTASANKKSNANARKMKQFSLFSENHNASGNQGRFAEGRMAIEELQGDNLLEIEEQELRYQKSRSNKGWMKEWTACNLFAYAFFQPYLEEMKEEEFIDSAFIMSFLKSGGSLNARVEAKANTFSHEFGFFHWPLEFPEIAEKGGFDLILGNPPWERIKLQEKEFFGEKDDAIAGASSAAARKKLIANLEKENPVLFNEFQIALNQAECASKFIRESDRYPLTGRGDVNTYSVFSELIKEGINKNGNAGFIVPTGIATDDTNKFYFADLVANGQLVSLFDFENKKAVFPNVHRSFKFCLLTLGGIRKNRVSQFGFFLHDVLDLQDKERIFTLSSQDFYNINPNTKTAPIFRTRKDAELTAKIYKKIPVLINEELEQNPWGAYYMRLVDLGDHANLIEHNLGSLGNTKEIYESKYLWQYDHRLATYSENDSDNLKNGNPIELKSEEKLNPQMKVHTRYRAFFNLSDTLYKKYKSNKYNFWLVWRDVTNATNERTTIATAIPKLMASRTCPGLGIGVELSFLVLANMNSIVFDYVARQKIGGLHLNWILVKQLPFLVKEGYGKDNCDFIVKRLLELTYTSWDIKAFADDVWKSVDRDLKEAIQHQWEENTKATGGHEWELPEWKDAYPEIEWNQEKGCPLPPFKWDEERRAVLKAELDAYYALLYGLERDDLRYILDPSDIYGDEFPGETFRVLKNKETKQYGEFRTQRLVLQAYDQLRPTWDMESHLERLDAIWKECNEQKAEPKPRVEETEVLANKPTGKKNTKDKNQIDLFSILPNEQVMKEFGLDEGIYTIADTASIINQKPDTVRRWFKKLAEAQYEGLSASGQQDVENRRISFHGLVELVVIGTLLENDFSIQKIFKARTDLASRTGKVYPFATNNVKENLKVAGKSIIFEFPDGKVTLDGTGQFNLELIKEFFRDIEFNTEGIAQRLIPEKGLKKIVIDPKVGGGKPSILDRNGLNVESIMEWYEGPDSIEDLLNDYDVTREEIEAAVAYSS